MFYFTVNIVKMSYLTNSNTIAKKWAWGVEKVYQGETYRGDVRLNGCIKCTKCINIKNNSNIAFLIGVVIQSISLVASPLTCSVERAGKRTVFTLRT